MHAWVSLYEFVWLQLLAVAPCCAFSTRWRRSFAYGISLLWWCLCTLIKSCLHLFDKVSREIPSRLSLEKDMFSHPLWPVSNFSHLKYRHQNFLHYANISLTRAVGRDKISSPLLLTASLFIHPWITLSPSALHKELMFLPLNPVCGPWFPWLPAIYAIGFIPCSYRSASTKTHL